MGNNEHGSKQPACFQVYNHTCVSTVVLWLCVMQQQMICNIKISPFLCAFSHKKSHFKCCKTNTLSLRHLWREGDLRGEALIEEPLLLGKPKSALISCNKALRVQPEPEALLRALYKCEWTVWACYCCWCAAVAAPSRPWSLSTHMICSSLTAPSSHRCEVPATRCATG